MKDGPAPVLPLGNHQTPQRGGDWQFAVEIFPPDWKCPAASFWVAGWIRSTTGQGAADVRAWLGAKLFLGLCGLPRPDMATAVAGPAGPSQAGFSFLLSANSSARELRLEVCDENGRWQEFYRHAIVPPREATALSIPENFDASGISRILLRLLIARNSQPAASWRQLADEALFSARAISLDALPNPPFYGRLELPQPVATVRFGLLEISGWIAHREERIKRLQAFIGCGAPVTLLHGMRRRDVTDVFGELRDGQNSQFVGYIEVPARLPHPVSLRIIADLESGQQHLAFNQRFQPQVTVESPSSLPVFSPLTFGRAACALWMASQRHASSLGTGAQVCRGLRSAWGEYRATAPVAASARIRLPSFAQTPARPMEVVVVTHNLNREGAPLIALEYARHLAAQPGWKVRVVSPEDGPLRASFLEAGVGIELVKLNAVWQAKSRDDFERALDLLRSECDWENASLVVANTMVSFWAINVAQRLKKPSILYVHESSSVRRFFAPLIAPQIMPSIEQAFGDASAVIFSAAASQLVHLRHERRKNFCVLPGWIDTRAISTYAAAHSPLELRRSKKFADDAVIFANIGSVCERKGQHVFVQAIDLLLQKRRSQRERTPPLVFLMVGASPGPFVDFLRHDVAHRRLEDVHLVEKVAEPHAYFRLADIFVCSSFEESLPRVVMEAAAFGLPIVSTDVNGIPEILGPEDALLFPPGNVARLADAMEAALGAHLRGDRTRAQCAQRTVCQHFDSTVLLSKHTVLAAGVACR